MRPRFAPPGTTLPALLATALLAAPAAVAQIAPSEQNREAMRAFATLDADSDGAITPADAPLIRRMPYQLFTVLDADDDGVVTRDEFVTGGRRGTWWSILDDDGDGAISARELEIRTSPAMIEGLDLNGDDRVTAGELRPGLPAPAPPSPPPMERPEPRTAERETPRSQPMIIGDDFYLGLDVEPGDYR